MKSIGLFTNRPTSSKVYKRPKINQSINPIDSLRENQKKYRQTDKFNNLMKKYGNRTDTYSRHKVVSEVTFQLYSHK